MSESHEESNGSSNHSAVDPEEARDHANGLASASSYACSPEKSVTAGLEPPRRTASYLESLPTAEAQLDEGIGTSVTTVTSEVIPVVNNPQTVEETEFESARGVKASLISISMYKEMNAGLGIRLKPVDGELIVSYVASDSPLSACLRAGDRVLALDDHICSRWTPRVAAVYIAEKLGPLSITVRNSEGDPDLAEAVVIKTHPQSRVGISFESRGGLLRIKTIFPDREIGSRSVLGSGDFVTSINEIPSADLDAPTATDLVRGTPKYVSILVNQTNATELSVRNMRARFSESSESAAFGTSAELIIANEVDIDDLEAGLVMRPSLVSVKMARPNTQVKFGINFRTSDEGLCISSIKDVGLLSTSPLKSGMKLVSVNNNYCRSWDSRTALNYFKDAVGDILIIAQDPDGDPLQVAAMAYKPSPRSLAGVRFVSTSSGIEFTKIEPDGIFADSVLNAGDVVLSINRMPCRHMTTSDVGEFLRHEPSSVTVHARTQDTTGIILSKFDDNADAQNPTGNERRQSESTTRKDAQCSLCFIIALGLVVMAIVAAGQNSQPV